jgi:hypothetical protein
MRQQVLAGALGFRRLKVVLKMLDAKMFEVNQDVCWGCGRGRGAGHQAVCHCCTECLVAEAGGLQGSAGTLAASHQVPVP